MNRAYLADALDFWKGGVFTRLQAAGALDQLHIDGMFTDPPWDVASLQVYANILGQPLPSITAHEATLADRQRYFEEVPHHGDIFLDPDTGVRTSGSNRPAYVNAAELDHLIAGDRLVIVYQHISRIRVLHRLQRVARHLHERIEGLHCRTANSATVALIFLSRAHGRVHAISMALQQIYGPQADTRTCDLPPEIAHS